MIQVTHMKMHTLPDKLRKNANTMQKTIDAKNTPTNWIPTARRARMDSHKASEARRLERVQAILYALARAWDNETIPQVLKTVTSRKMVEYLEIYPNPPTAGGWDGSSFKSFEKAQLTDTQKYHEARSRLLALIDPSVGKTTRADEIREIERGLIGIKMDGYFPTPRPVALRVVESAQISGSMTILEPSAGKGNLIDVLVELYPDVKVDAIEIRQTLSDILKLKGYNVIGADCFGTAFEKKYDRVIMNPPFERFQDIDQIEWIYKHALKAGGRLVSVVSASTQFRTDTKAEDFRDWVKTVGGKWIEVEDGSFRMSERTTGVKVWIVVIPKPDQ